MKLETRLANIIFFVLLAQTPGVFNTNVFMGNRYWATTSEKETMYEQKYCQLFMFL